MLERLDGKIKPRADVVSIFPNGKAIVRVVCALLMEQNDEFAIQKRYMSLESLAAMSENPAIRLLAAPALASSTTRTEEPSTNSATCPTPRAWWYDNRHAIDPSDRREPWTDGRTRCAAPARARYGGEKSTPAPPPETLGRVP